MVEWTKKYNPFNSDKLLAQVPRWKQIERGKPLPAPALVTVDPINSCNYACTWCNAEYILGHNTGMISNKILDGIADFLKEWEVPTVCIAGGGEPLMHPYTGNFIERLARNGVKSGVVTNGLYLDKHLDSLSNCTWVGVSMDSASQETLTRLKKAQPGDFERTIKGIERLAKLGGELGKPGQAHGVSYKYLLHPGNVPEVYAGAKLAKELGCRNFHLRPFGTPWDQLGEEAKEVFTYREIEAANEQIEKARELEDDTFRVFGITHKFDGNFQKANEFKTCHAIFMTGVFMPPTSKEEGFDLGLCCDRRGDDMLTVRDLKDLQQVREFLGSEQHWEMFDKIKVDDCPRCTYQPHNMIFENVIEEDNMSPDFI